MRSAVAINPCGQELQSRATSDVGPMSAWGHSRRFRPRLAMSALAPIATKLVTAWQVAMCHQRPKCIAENGKAAQRRPSPSFDALFVQATARAFCFLRQPSRPKAPRPLAKRGRVPGSGIAAGVTTDASTKVAGPVESAFTPNPNITAMTVVSEVKSELVTVKLAVPPTKG